MRITVVGAGHAGLVTAAGFARFGHMVNLLEIDAARVTALREGRAPFFEPDLDRLLAEATANERLRYFVTDEAAAAYEAAELVFIVVDTPRGVDGNVDLSQLQAALATAAPLLSDGVVVVIKSTVPVGTTREVAVSLGELRPELRFRIAHNPEFLSQGSAVADFLAPDRIVIGVDEPEAADAVRRAHQPLVDRKVPVLVTAVESAELIKYGSNSFLAIKLSFINEMADLSEASGAIIEEVAAGIGMDRRIGPAFLRPGPGFGGACLPKDTRALLHTSHSYGTHSRIVAAALRVNEERVQRMVDKILDATPGEREGKKVAMLGITFKAATDDTRESPAVDIAAALAASGAAVCVYDPRGMDTGRAALPSTVSFGSSPYDAAAGAEVVVIATEWPEFADLDLVRLRRAVSHPVLVDLRNVLRPGAAAAAGFDYHPIGRRSG